MYKNRAKELLLKAAEALDDGSDPFATHFLTTNRVSLEEALALADDVADCIRARISQGHEIGSNQP